MAAAIAGVTGGFSANLLITPLDRLLAGLTQAAAQIIDSAYEVQSTVTGTVSAARLVVEP
jgi:aminobenzoyl-glutamate transport protein